MVGGKNEIFLPWEKLNGSNSPLFDLPEQAKIVASLCHPNWGACKPAARKFHARNCQQVCGQDMEAPVDFVLFWAPEENGTVKGGTATAVFLAREMKIPTFNLREEETRERWLDLVTQYEHRQKRLWRSLFAIFYSRNNS